MSFTARGRISLAPRNVPFGAYGSGALSSGGLTRVLLFLFAAVAMTATVMVLAIPPAAKADPKGVVGWIGNPTSSEPDEGGFFNDPMGVAVSETGAGAAGAGDVYVVDDQHDRIQQFDSAGNFIRAWGRDVIKNGRPNNSGTDPEICDTTAGNIADDCQAGEDSGSGVGGGFDEPEGIAINQTTGDVYVTDRNDRRVQQFDAAGNFIRTWGKDVIISGRPNNNGTGFEICDTTAGNVATDCKAGVDGSLGGEIDRPGASGSMSGIAVAPSTAPNAGNVLIPQADLGRIEEYTSTGQWVRAFGWDIVGPGGAENLPGNEMQEITIAAADGNFTLTFDGQTTNPLPFDSAAATVQAELEGLSNIGVGDVTVSGGPGDASGSSPYTVEFMGAYADQDVPQIEVNDSALIVAVGHTFSCAGPPTGGTTEYQWLRNAAPIAGETSDTYTTVGADAGTVIQCRVAVVHGPGSGLIQASTPIRVVDPAPAAPLPVPPAALPEVSVVSSPGPEGDDVGSSGGRVLGCNTGAWGNTPLFSSYQWYRNGVPLVGNGANTAEYTLQSADLATTAYFQCSVIGTTAGGSATVVSGFDTLFGDNGETEPGPVPEPDPVAATSDLGAVTTTSQGANFEVCTIATDCNIGVTKTTGEVAMGDFAAGQWAFGPRSGVEVDSSGAIYGAGFMSVSKFTSQVAPPGLDAEKFGSTEPQPYGAPTSTTEAFGFRLRAIAIDENDDLLVLRRLDGMEFLSSDCPGRTGESNEVIQSISSDGTTLLHTHLVCAGIVGTEGIAANKANGDILISGDSFNSFSEGADRVVYLGDIVDPSINLDPVNPTATSATVTGTSNPNSDLSYPNPTPARFQLQYKQSSDAEWITFGSPIDIGAGNTPIPFNNTIFPLQTNTSYDVRAIATKEPAAGETVSAPVTFSTLAAPPSIEAFRSLNVNESSADLRAVINPRGSETTYHFEYGQTLTYGNVTPIPEANIGDGQGGVEVTHHIDGLDPATYHFRVVATNAAGTTTSVDQTFDFFPPPCPNSAVRQQTKANYLPDCRAYELASARYAGGTLLFPSYGPNPDGGHPTNPSRLAYFSFFGAIPDVGDVTNTGGDLYVTTRTDTGWNTRYVGLPGDEVFIMGAPPLTIRGVDEQPTNPAMDRFVRWNVGDGGGIELDVVRGPFSFAPYVLDHVGNMVDRWPTNLTSVAGGDDFVGYSRTSGDLSHFVFSSDVPFTNDGVPGDIYDNDVEAGTVDVVSRDPNGAPFEGTPVEVSRDGENILMANDVFLSCGEFADQFGYGGACAPPDPAEFYMRINGQTFDVTKGHLGKYADMTRDGSKVYFHSDEQVTADDTDTSTDLFLWEEATDAVTRVSAGEPGTGGDTDSCNAVDDWTEKCGISSISEFQGSDAAQGNSAQHHFFAHISRVEGGVGGNGHSSDFFVAPQSGDIYFLSPEQLEVGKGVPGRVNLYVYRTAEERAQFVASLDTDKHCLKFALGVFPPTCDVPSETPVSRIEVTPNGRYAAFTTPSQLTPYDNAGFAMMYRYDAVEDELLCVSCNPTGASPTGDVYGSQNGLFMTNDGRVFFSTTDGLAPNDTNEAIDVYEFVNGRAQLISSGVGHSVVPEIETTLESIARPGLIGVSADGTDAYFSTYNRLVDETQDQNGGNLRVYDARTNGGFPVPPPALPCEAADECHAGNSTPPAAIQGGTKANLGQGSNVRVNRCAGLARKAQRRSRWAKALRRRAARSSGEQARRMRRRARRLARSTRRMSNRAKRCRRAQRRAARANRRAGR